VSSPPAAAPPEPIVEKAAAYEASDSEDDAPPRRPDFHRKMSAASSDSDSDDDISKYEKAIGNRYDSSDSDDDISRSRAYEKPKPASYYDSEDDEDYKPKPKPSYDDSDDDEPVKPRDATPPSSYAAPRDEPRSRGDEEPREESRSRYENPREESRSRYEDDSDDDYDYKKSRSSTPDEDDELASRLKQLLKDDNSSRESSKNRDRRRHEQSRPAAPAPPVPAPVAQQQAYEPPSLAQLESNGVFQGQKTLPNIAYTSQEEEEDEDKKRELLFKFDILKKSYKDATIPEFTIHSDYTTMVRSYDLTLRKVSLDSTVETYKQYLVGGFMVVEYVFGKFFNLDMQGFTQQQMVSMTSYERLLIEMGEKSYVPGESKWPVELRLLFLIIINAAVFLLTRMVMKRTGSNLMGVFNSLGGMAGNAASNGAPVRKKKMQGPSVNFDELPDN
jgi:hypothetical protein